MYNSVAGESNRWKLRKDFSRFENRFILYMRAFNVLQQNCIHVSSTEKIEKVISFYEQEKKALSHNFKSISVKMPNCYLCGKIEESVFCCPKEPSIRKQWFSFCDIGKEYFASMKLSLCSKHFEENCIVIDENKTKIKEDAVPNRNQKNWRDSRGIKNRHHGSCEICCRNGFLPPPDKRVSFFSFPSNAVERKKWINFCEIEEDELPKTPYLCSLHFSADQILKRSPYLWCLRKGQIPISYDPILNAEKSNAEVDADEEVTNGDITSSNGNDETLAPDMVTVKLESLFVEEEEIIFDGDISSYEGGEASICDSEHFERSAATIREGEETTATTQSNNDSVNASLITPSKRPNKSIRRLHFVGDVQPSDFQSPTTAEKAFQIAKDAAIKHRRTSIILRKRLTRAQKRVEDYKKVIEDLKRRLRVSEKRLTLLAVRDSPV